MDDLREKAIEAEALTMHGDIMGILMGAVIGAIVGFILGVLVGAWLW